jgi:16S rRNA (guanine966-N2)-methyltransferase
MRIISGKLGGRSFKSPPGHRTHPMSDKARGALFSALGDISGLTVLDAFAGSGALSFEAVSRGATHAQAIDSDKNAQKTIADNIDTLDLTSSIKLIRANVSAWSDSNPDHQFDLVLCDPPYDYLQPNLLQKLVRHVEPTGMFVLSWPKGEAIPVFPGLNLLKASPQGDAVLVFYRRIGV